MFGPDGDNLAAHWLAAIARPEISAALESLYARATTEISSRGPSCWASGRCCNFEKTGHLLYVTGLEAAYTIAKLPDIAATRPENFPERTLRQLTLDQAKSRGTCPFQTNNLCGVHPIRPIGCRVYFCDRSAQGWQQELSENLLAEVRAIHEQFTIEYRYAEWRAMLGMFVAQASRL